MILKITSDAAYLVQPKARSRAAVHYHLGWHNKDRVNGALDVLCQIIKPKPKPVASILAANMPVPSVPPSQNSDTLSLLLARLLKPTTTLPKASSTQKCAKSFPKRLTCATGG
jgi:hypothetical protein